MRIQRIRILSTAQGTATKVRVLWEFVSFGGYFTTSFFKDSDPRSWNDSHPMDRVPLIRKIFLCRVQKVRILCTSCVHPYLILKEGRLKYSSSVDSRSSSLPETNSVFPRKYSWILKILGFQGASNPCVGAHTKHTITNIYKQNKFVRLFYKISKFYIRFYKKNSKFYISEINHF